MHQITSVRYANPDNGSGYEVDAPVIVTRNGQEEQRTANDDINGGGVIAFLAEGGTIDPFYDTELSPEEIVEIKRNAKVRISNKADEMGSLISGSAPQFEKLSWSDKRDAAIYAKAEIAAGRNPDANVEPRLKIISNEALVTGEDLESLCDAILSHVEGDDGKYYEAAGLIAGQRRVAHAAIDALTETTYAALNKAIQDVFDQSQESADALLASLM